MNEINYPKVSIVVLTWNNYADTRDCLASLDKISYPNYDVIVVDNGSVDGSTQNLQKEFRQHTYIYNKENLGFSGGNNVGWEHALKSGADFILAINNDVVLEENFLQPLVNIALGGESVGIVGPAIYSYREPDKLSPTGGKINYWRINTKVYELDHPVEMDWVYDCCLLVKREVVEKIGYFYAPFFLSYEDVDYCVRAKKAGFKTIYEPGSKIWHKSGVSLGKIPASYYYYFNRNKMLFIKRNAPDYVKYPFYFYFSSYLVLRIAQYLLRKDSVAAFATAGALFDFWLGRFGKKEFSKKSDYVMAGFIQSVKDKLSGVGGRFPKISSIRGWAGGVGDNFSALLRLAKFRGPLGLIARQTVLLAGNLIYPVPRIIFGKEKADEIGNPFLRDTRAEAVFPLPAPLKGRIAMGRVDPRLYDEIYLSNIYFQEILEKGMRVVDIGANIGAYTILAAEKVGKEGKVIAIEPEPKNYEQLAKNVKLNGLSNVDVKKMALTDHEGSEKLYLYPVSYSGGHSLVIKDGKNNSIEVPVKTLDNLLKDAGWSGVDVIKIDTEGAEMLILRGAEKTLKANPNLKMMIAAEHYQSQAKEVVQFLNERGFKTKITKDNIIMTINR